MLPAPFILPFSATITRTPTSRLAYAQALEGFSKPFMDRFRPDCSFGPSVKHADGLKADFHFSGYDDALLTWAFPDLTMQAEYLCHVIQQTIELEMRQEAGFLFELRQVRERVKEVIEGSDMEIDRLVRSIRLNDSRISGKLESEFPILANSEVAAAVVAAIRGE